MIKKWISQDLQDELFEHTRSIKKRKLIAPIEKDFVTTLKVKKDRPGQNNLYLVRKKSNRSPGGTGILF